MRDAIGLKKLGDILGMHFMVPDYQRGYRWKSRQVTDLLEDIGEFMEKATQAKDGFYCLQPLVVKETIANPENFMQELSAPYGELLARLRSVLVRHIEWEVIDGQQRLTTAYLIISYLIERLEIENVSLYTLRYVTRDASAEFLKRIGDKTLEDSESNIDFWHLYAARKTICNWFERDESRQSREYQKRYLNTLLGKVQFIWYETAEKNPIRVFTRLNIGKIALTNSELIKALFLSKITDENPDKMRLRQMEIASQWDEIENRLQNDEFWMFIHPKGFDRTTRIDSLFDLSCRLKLLDDAIGWTNEEKEQRLGGDRYRTFRYFQAYFQSDHLHGDKAKIHDCWAKVKTVYDAFDEWFNDLLLYHYVGYLIACAVGIEEILAHFLPSTKPEFLAWSKAKINAIIGNCNDLGTIYDVSGAPPKTRCLPLLLLHNVQTVINQNQAFKAKKNYELPVFYKFPFHLYKKESWNVEHIDSNTENALTDRKTQAEWLKAAWCFLIGNSDDERNLRREILAYFNANGGNAENADASEKFDFEDLQNRILRVFKIADKNSDAAQQLTPDEKNMIWNFTLLDERTNKSYGNDIFPIKKTILLGKDRGVEYVIQAKREEQNKNIVGFEIVANNDEHDEQSERKPNNGRRSYLTAFVPPVTKSVFLKAFGQLSNNPYSWDRTDARAYRRNIRETLTRAGFKVSDMEDRT